MTALSEMLKVGQRLQIPKDQYGRAILEFDREKREYIEGKLQWFEVVSVGDDDVKLKAVWLCDEYHDIEIAKWPGGGAPPAKAVWVGLPCGCEKNRLTGEIRK